MPRYHPAIYEIGQPDAQLDRDMAAADKILARELKRARARKERAQQAEHRRHTARAAAIGARLQAEEAACRIAHDALERDAFTAWEARVAGADR